MRTFSRRGHTSESHESWTRTWQLAYVRSRSASFHTPVDTFAKWPDWSEDIPRGARAEAQRLVKDARLLRWVGDQNCALGVAPPPHPQFVWEKLRAIAIDCDQDEQRRAASWRPVRSAAAKKWMQRFRHRWNLSLGNCLPETSCQLRQCRPRLNKGSQKMKQWFSPSLHNGVRRATPVLGPRY